MVTKKIAQILDDAIKLEEFHNKLFSRVKDLVKDKKSKEILAMLAKQKMLHAERLNMVKGLYEKNQTEFKVDILFEVPSVDPAEEFDSAEKILKKVITKQKKISQFYKILASQSVDRMIKKAFEELADAEDVHMLEIEFVVNSIAPKEKSDA